MTDFTYRIEVWLKPHVVDGRAEGLMSSIASLGYEPERIAVTDLYFIQGALSGPDVERLCQELLADSVSQGYRWAPVLDTNCGPVAQPSSTSPDTGPTAIEVTFHPGVTDSVAESIVRGSATIGVCGVEQAATGTRFVLNGALTSDQAMHIARSVLCNEIIQHFSLVPAQPPFAHISTSRKRQRVEIIPILRATARDLEDISRQRLMSLNLEEMQAIQTYFRGEGREPTDAELESVAQTWSEHCGHKSFRGLVDYEEHREDGTVRREQIDGLLDTYLRRATEEAGKPWIRSAFVDNAGVIDFEDGYEISFKVETHNHPSALEPFGGANTGVGGVIRDIIGVSARPIANTDVLCFGPQDRSLDDLPANVLHPRRVFAGVVAGIEDYGNKMGIPTVGGAILFDPGYEANPLVFCGCLGIAPVDMHPRNPGEGDRIIVIGGRTGRDGLRGATFSSAELTHATAEESGSAVQIGNPIVEKKSLEAIIEARDARLYNAITDCGAGGLSSAVGEMGSELGVEVHLERVPLKYAGLSPWEIWLSEAQERMVLAVPPHNLDRVMAICGDLDVEATDIGEFTGMGRLSVHFDSTTVVDMSMEFLHRGIPQRELKGTWKPRDCPCPEHHTGDLTPILLDILRSPNVASKETVIRLYDHEVQGATVIKPLVGTREHGPSDAAVLKPLQVPGWKGIVLSHGINPCYGAVDPYLMAQAAIDEAIRNAVCVGASPDHLAVLDNFCWGNPNLPDRMGELVRACKGCYDGSGAYQVPFISGKDSLNNEYTDGLTGHKVSIPPTLLISAVSIIPDVRRATTMDLKKAGNLIYAIGETGDELGGSHYYRLQDAIGDKAPQPAKEGLKIARALHEAIMNGLVRACHDCSEGGWAVTLAEMALAGELGLDLRLGTAPGVQDLPDSVTCCFSESNGRYAVEVRPEDSSAFESAMSGCPIAQIGTVTSDPVLIIRGSEDAEIIRAAVSDLEHAWRSSLPGQSDSIQERVEGDSIHG